MRRIVSIVGSVVAISCSPSVPEEDSAQEASLDYEAPPPPNAHVASGGKHNCVIARRGVRCWGLNSSGQTEVPPLRHPQQITAGAYHTCAIDDDGVKCWGDNEYGQTNVPVGIRRPRQVVAGSLHTCVLSDEGVKVQCWGGDRYGETRPPKTLYRPRQLALGSEHSCAIDEYGLQCWGDLSSGQHKLANTTGIPTQIVAADRYSCGITSNVVKCSANISLPAVSNPTRISMRSAHVCALGTDGVACSGPWAPPPLRNPTEIAAGERHACALDADAFKCWGSETAPYGVLDVPAGIDLVSRHTCMVSTLGARCTGHNEHGQLGAGDDVDRLRALAASTATDLGSAFAPPTQVATGRAFACALAKNGSVKCWGANDRGQLGLGDDRDRGLVASDMGDALPALRFENDAAMTKLAAGEGHACAVSARGDVFCWGAGRAGQLGTESVENVGITGGPTRPRLKAGLAIGDVALGLEHTCLASTDGGVYCFGRNDRGQLGIGSKSSVGDRPGTMGNALVRVELGAGFLAKALASGERHVCALSIDGRVKCWGANDAGQLGLGDTRDRGLNMSELGDALPVVDLGRNQVFTDLACGARHCCAKSAQNTMKCWGDNAEGQLGLGDTIARGAAPASMGDDLPWVATPARERVHAIQLVDERTCARTDSGLRCWGRNRSGELGYGDRDPRGTTPATLPKLLAPLGI